MQPRHRAREIRITCPACGNKWDEILTKETQQEFGSRSFRKKQEYAKERYEKSDTAEEDIPTATKARNQRAHAQWQSEQVGVNSTLTVVKRRLMVMGILLAWIYLLELAWPEGYRAILLTLTVGFWVTLWACTRPVNDPEVGHGPDSVRDVIVKFFMVAGLIVTGLLVLVILGGTLSNLAPSSGGDYDVDYCDINPCR